MSTIKEWFVKILAPHNLKCIFCGDEIFDKNKYSSCNKCILPYNTKYCSRCGRAIANMSIFCNDCMTRAVNFDKAIAPFVYEKQIIKIIRKLKYGNGKYLAPYLAQYMLDMFLPFAEQWGIDMITFVPLHAKRKMQRGYNQAELLADVISQSSNIPIIELLTKLKHIKNLARLSRQEREALTKGVYGVNKSIDIKEKTILLIDDVFTTGSTANECSKVLKESGAKAVYVLTVATGRKKPLLYGNFVEKNKLKLFHKTKRLTHKHI